MEDNKHQTSLVRATAPTVSSLDDLVRAKAKRECNTNTGQSDNPDCLGTALALVEHQQPPEVKLLATQLQSALFCGYLDLGLLHQANSLTKHQKKTDMKFDATQSDALLSWARANCKSNKLKRRLFLMIRAAGGVTRESVNKTDEDGYSAAMHLVKSQLGNWLFDKQMDLTELVDWNALPQGDRGHSLLEVCFRKSPETEDERLALDTLGAKIVSQMSISCLNHLKIDKRSVLRCVGQQAFLKTLHTMLLRVPEGFKIDPEWVVMYQWEWPNPKQSPRKFQERRVPVVRRMIESARAWEQKHGHVSPPIANNFYSREFQTFLYQNSFLSAREVVNRLDSNDKLVCDQAMIAEPFVSCLHSIYVRRMRNAANSALNSELRHELVGFIRSHGGVTMKALTDYDSNGNNALHAIVCFPSAFNVIEEELKLTAEKIDWNQQAPHGHRQTPLLACLSFDRNGVLNDADTDDTAAKLVSFMSSDALNAVDAQGDTAITLAIKGHCLKTTKALLSRAPAIELDTTSLLFHEQLPVSVEGVFAPLTSSTKKATLHEWWLEACWQQSMYLDSIRDLLTAFPKSLPGLVMSFLSRKYVWLN